MCLKVDEKSTKRFQKRKQPILCYKVVDVFDGELWAPVVACRYKIDPDTLEYSNGSSLKSKVTKGVWFGNMLVSEGVHVFTKKADAEVYKANHFKLVDETLVVRCWVNPEDVVGASTNNQLAAKRIFFHKEDVSV